MATVQCGYNSSVSDATLRKIKNHGTEIQDDSSSSNKIASTPTDAESSDIYDFWNKDNPKSGNEYDTPTDLKSEELGKSNELSFINFLIKSSENTHNEKCSNSTDFTLNFSNIDSSNFEYINQTELSINITEGMENYPHLMKCSNESYTTLDDSKLENNLSDMLANIWKDENNQTNSGANSNLCEVILNPQNIPFDHVQCESTNEICYSNNNMDSNLSNLLSSICFDDDNVKASFTTDNQFVIDSCSKSSNFMKATDSENEAKISLADLAKEHLSSSASINLPNIVLHNQESFNSNVHINISKKLENNVEDLSMLDLLASVNNSNNKNTCSLNTAYALNKEPDSGVNSIQCNKNVSTPSIAVENILSTTISTNSSNAETLNNDEADLSICNFDLTCCLKSEKHSFVPPDLQAVKNYKNTIIGEINWSDSNISQSTAEQQEEVSKFKNINPKKSLFSKALACKSKVNNCALQKVLSLKKNLCQQFFNPSIRLDTEIRKSKELVKTTNECVISTVTRRIFGPDPTCELH